MFEYIGMIHLMQLQSQLRADQKFNEMIQDMPIEDQIRMRKDRDATIEKQRQEAVIERRHREHMEALDKIRWATILSGR